MPYKFETDRLPMPKGKDRRMKLTDEQRQSIREEYAAGGIGKMKLAKKYGVSKGTVVYIIHPERRVRNYEIRVARGGSKQYYDKEVNRKAVQSYRLHKKKALDEDTIKPKGKTE